LTLTGVRKSAYMRRYYLKNRHAIRAAQLERERGPAYWVRRERSWKRSGVLFDGKPLTAEVFRAVVAFQGDQCALCGRDSFWGALQADHNHKTGEFRGALDMECNHHAVGVFEAHARFKSPAHETRIKRYLLASPVERWVEAGKPSEAECRAMRTEAGPL
jgi:hypothetical protein